MRRKERWVTGYALRVTSFASRFTHYALRLTGASIKKPLNNANIGEFSRDGLTASIVRRKGVVQKGPLSDPPNPGALRRALPQARPQGLPAFVATLAE